jgi:DNA-binding response OmpR family regulator
VAEPVPPVTDAHDRVLVVDDDPPLRRMLERTLAAEGFDVTVAADGAAALVATERSAPDVIVLDVAMPGLDGLAVCRRLRGKGLPTPILMLTARDAVPDRVAGLEAGADDYLVKPFSPRELVLRVQSVLRRSGVTASAAGLPRRLVAGDVEVDVPGRSVAVAGRPVALTTREFDLLVHLMAHPGRAYTRAQLMNEVWGWEFGDTSTVTVHVRRLREKLEADPSDPRRLVTVWGVGYRWEGAA